MVQDRESRTPEDLEHALQGSIKEAPSAGIDRVFTLFRASTRRSLQTSTASRPRVEAWT
jgi:hypothetical protein